MLVGTGGGPTRECEALGLIAEYTVHNPNRYINSRARKKMEISFFRIPKRLILHSLSLSLTLLILPS